ncbi:hypothetical protein Fmac_017980 [Flemingia macrophylla]|uniref:Uncharacterized protein n=1 Tax=Flemingia macrophylla TaxID=520843 RepID=A0ABD1M3N9_9FABA
MISLILLSPSCTKRFKIWAQHLTRNRAPSRTSLVLSDMLSFRFLKHKSLYEALSTNIE